MICTACVSFSVQTRPVLTVHLLLGSRELSASKIRAHEHYISHIFEKGFNLLHFSLFLKHFLNFLFYILLLHLHSHLHTRSVSSGARNTTTTTHVVNAELAS